MPEVTPSNERSGRRGRVFRPLGRVALLTALGLLVLLVVLHRPPPWAQSSSLRQSQGTPGVTPTAPPQGLPTVDGGINAVPSMRPWRLLGANPDGWWCRGRGCSAHRDPLTLIHTEMRLAHRLNVAVLRLEFPWFLIEPRPAVFDWRRADAIVRTARKFHLQLEPVLVFAPKWAAAAPNRAPHPADFAAFVTAVVRRYHHTIHYWEMWNEPNLPQYWLAGVSQYVSDILIPGYGAVKRADRHAHVILGAPSSADIGWLSRIYADGGGDSFDIMAYHSYVGAGKTLAGARLIQNLLVAHGQGAKTIWLGEYGVQQQAVDDQQQVNLMTAIMTATTPIDVAIWYNLRDDYAEACCPVQRIKVGYWGLVQHDDSIKKQGFSVMRDLISQETQADGNTR